MIFEVWIGEEYSNMVDIEADNQDEAISIAQEMLRNGQIELYPDLAGESFEANEK